MEWESVTLLLSHVDIGLKWNARQKNCDALSRDTVIKVKIIELLLSLYGPHIALTGNTGDSDS